MEGYSTTQRCCANLEADIASVLLARLEGLFNRNALGLHDGAPQPGSFLARLGNTAFWSCTMRETDQPRYSPAVRFYLDTLFPESCYMRFGDYCRIWAQSFHATRHDTDSARDLLLLFLNQNLSCLKRLYILDQPHNQDLPPSADALERCFDTPANATLFAGDRFSRWVLDDWLPFHVRTMHCSQGHAHAAGLVRRAATAPAEDTIAP